MTAADRTEALHEIYDDFYEISEELEDAVTSFELLQEDIRIALDDIGDEIETIRENLKQCSRGFRRISRLYDAENRPSGTGRAESP